MNERDYLLSLTSFISYGPKRTGLLLSYFGSAQKAWEARPGELIQLGLSPSLVEKFVVHRDSFDFGAYKEHLDAHSISFVTLSDPEYPIGLSGLSDAPPVLYVKGSLLSRDSVAVAIVGTRKMTSYGKDVAGTFAQDLASYGVTIISGLARGIDTVAHTNALLCGGRTIAVIGCGLDLIYPPENIALAKKIIDGHGAILSEYPLGYPALPSNFAARNRLISGLSKAVIVVEGQAKSGTLLTAKAAAEQGRTVFAVPGPISSPLSEAPHILIKNGCPIATTSRDILDELNLQVQVDHEAVQVAMPSDEIEHVCIDALSHESLHLDELARISMLPVAQVLAKLTIMELKGMVKHLGNGVYKKL